MIRILGIAGNLHYLLNPDDDGDMPCRFSSKTVYLVNIDISIHEYKHMVQISRNPIHKDVFYEIRDDFLWVMAQLAVPDEVKSFFYDFFTKTERVMFAKRLAIAMMVYRGYNYRDIQHILHVSTSTITRIANWLDQGGIGVKHALDKLAREEKMEAFWNKVNRLIDQYVVHPRLTH